VRRLARLLLHNWPLKLAAVGLATLLYGGLILSQATLEFRGVIEVVPENQPEGTFLLLGPEPVTVIRYLSPSGVRPTAAVFRATVDLASVKPGAGRQAVPVVLRSDDDRITVLGTEPDVVVVELDTLIDAEVPVVVDAGVTPPALVLGPTVVEPAVATIRGPATLVRSVVAVRATVVFQPGGIDVDTDAPLVPVDAQGESVRQVEVDPRTARVTIPVFSDRQSRTLPVTPLIAGTPAAGFEMASVSVDPPIVTVEGDADQLIDLVSIDTEPVSIAGLAAERTFSAALALPDGVGALGITEVRVTVTVRPVTATRSFEVGLRLDGSSPDLVYQPAVDRVLVTIGGSIAELDRLTGGALVAILDVAELDVGATQVPVAMDLPSGLSLVASSPESVRVVVTVAASPPPSQPPAAATPTPAPSPSR
jgi:YbbR domain-containing protein